MKLTELDLAYIAKKTGLTTDRASVLCEDSLDLNLVLNEISRSFKKHECTLISYELYVKLVFFLSTQSRKDFDIAEKIFVSDSACKYIHSFKKKNKYLSANSKPHDEALILAGLFSTKINPKELNYKLSSNIEKGFWDAGMTNVGKHVNDWITVMKDIQKEGWFKTEVKNKCKSACDEQDLSVGS